jgi:hypothetical protein
MDRTKPWMVITDLRRPDRCIVSRVSPAFPRNFCTLKVKPCPTLPFDDKIMKWQRVRRARDPPCHYRQLRLISLPNQTSATMESNCCLIMFVRDGLPFSMVTCLNRSWHCTWLENICLTLEFRRRVLHHAGRIQTCDELSPCCKQYFAQIGVTVQKLSTAAE